MINCTVESLNGKWNIQESKPENVHIMGFRSRAMRSYRGYARRESWSLASAGVVSFFGPILQAMKNTKSAHILAYISITINSRRFLEV